MGEAGYMNICKKTNNKEEFASRLSEKLLVSVIIPIYNTEKYLDRCIESIINQSYQSLEIILVDDGSTDNSINICRKYQMSDSRVSIISQENKGASCARKAGLMMANGELIGFIDSDDWIEPEMYEKMVRIYEEFHPELISTGVSRDYEGTECSQKFYDHYAEGFYQNLEQDIYPTMLRDNEARDFGLYCTLVNKLFKKNKLMEVYEDINTEVFLEKIR